MNSNAKKSQDIQNNPQDYYKIYCGMPYETIKGYLGGEPNSTYDIPNSNGEMNAFWDDVEAQKQFKVDIASKDNPVVIGIAVAKLDNPSVADWKAVMGCSMNNGKWITMFESKDALK